MSPDLIQSDLKTLSTALDTIKRMALSEKKQDCQLRAVDKASFWGDEDSKLYLKQTPKS